MHVLVLLGTGLRCSHCSESASAGLFVLSATGLRGSAFFETVLRGSAFFETGCAGPQCSELACAGPLCSEPSSAGPYYGQLSLRSLFRFVEIGVSVSGL